MLTSVYVAHAWKLKKCISFCMRDRVSKAQGAAYFRIRQHSKMISTFQRQGGLLQVIHIL